LGFLSKNCTLKVLNAEVIEKCNPFDCGHSDLNDFFINDSINYSKELLGKSYCFILDNDPQTIICAFTISNDSIKIDLLPNSRKKKVIKDIPRQKQFKSYPAVLIGRLGVNKKFKGKGIGNELMDFIKAWFVDPENKTGCRFIVVDAYNEIAPLRYYTNNGFIPIYSTEEQEKENTGIHAKLKLKTRLLYFDLIVLSAKF
jgi:GNAT superfamily N-acetyltransferase